MSTLFFYSNFVLANLSWSGFWRMIIADYLLGNPNVEISLDILESTKNFALLLMNSPSTYLHIRFNILGRVVMLLDDLIIVWLFDYKFWLKSNSYFLSYFKLDSEFKFLEFEISLFNQTRSSSFQS